MGSLIDNIDCPVCKSPEASNDFYYKTGEEYTHCHQCGYYHSLTLKDRSKPLNDPGNWELRECKNPFGSYGLRLHNHPGAQFGTLETEESYLKLKFEVERDPEISNAWVRRFIDGKIVEEILVEETPST